MDHSSSRSWLFIGALISIYLIKTLFHGMTNPLRRIPGPWYTSYTRLPLKLAIISGRRMYYVQNLHEKYGPYVLIAPNEVSVTSPEAVSRITRPGNNFNKSDFYEKLTGWSRWVLFTMTDQKVHAARRKMFARAFSKSHLRQHWEGSVREIVKLAVWKMKQDASESGNDGVIDLLKWWTLMATDVSSTIMFGESFHTLEAGETNDYIKALTSANKGQGIGLELPLVLYIGRRLPFQVCQQHFNSSPKILEYGEIAVRNSKMGGSHSNIFTKIIAESEKGETLDEVDVNQEASSLMIAGTDTTAITLTYLVWAVLSHPEWQRLLETEVGGLADNFTEVDLESLPVLNAIINETLRLYGAAPGGLPRIVPDGGAQVGEYFLPGGVTVTTQAYSLHRDASLFPNPYQFDPTRFMPTTDSKNQLSKAAESVFSPFGSDNYNCLGIHLARMELLLGTAEFFRSCVGAKLAPRTTVESMEMENFFLITPKAHRCEVDISNST